MGRGINLVLIKLKVGIGFVAALPGAFPPAANDALAALDRRYYKTKLLPKPTASISGFGSLAAPGRSGSSPMRKAICRPTDPASSAQQSPKTKEPPDMKLAEIASNPQGLQQTLGAEIKLDRIKLIQIVYDQEGPRVTVRFDLPDYPATPPEKWKAQGFNTVQLRISFIGVSCVSQRGWSNSNTVEVSFAKEETGHYVARMDGHGVSFETKFAHLSIDRISAYKNTL